jgi:hypothetical protein
MRESDAVTVGVLSLHSSKETKAILNAVDDPGHGTEWLRTENIAVDIRDGRATLEPDVDVVANRLLLSNVDVTRRADERGGDRTEADAEE